MSKKSTVPREWRAEALQRSRLERRTRKLLREGPERRAKELQRLRLERRLRKIMLTRAEQEAMKKIRKG